MRVDYDRMSDNQTTESFVPLRQAALNLGLPIVWLQAEAKAGRIPNLKVGRRMYFNCEAVKAELISQATVKLNRQEEESARKVKTDLDHEL